MKFSIIFQLSWMEIGFQNYTGFDDINECDIKPTDVINFAIKINAIA